MVVAPLCEGPRMREATDTLAIYESERGRSTRLVPESVSHAEPCIIGLASDRAGMLTFGRSRFDALDFDQATRALSALVDSFERLPALDGDLQVLIEAHAYLAWAASERKDNDTAHAQLNAACVLNPNLKLDANRFPPAVASAATQVCREVMPTGLADFESVPAGTHIYVDAIERCTAACNVTLPAGEHFVSIRTGAQRTDMKIDVVARGKQRIDASPDVTIAERMRTAIATHNVTAVGQDLAEGDGIIVILDEIVNGIQSWTTRPPFQTIAGPTLIIDAARPHDGAAARLAVDTMLATLPLPVVVPAAQVRLAQPIYKKWWLWAAVGAVAVGTVTAIAIAASHNNDVTIKATVP